MLSQKVEDGDEVFDEIDKFHAEYDAKLLKIVKQPKKPLAKEVLRVISDEDFSDDEEGFSDDEESLNNSYLFFYYKPPNTKKQLQKEKQ